ncbi:MAG TPA: TonB-dependent receptor [Chitinophagaceae bacterium]|nr:TonB-dependent receptor [Chitinophagaceae bacterium]
MKLMCAFLLLAGLHVSAGTYSQDRVTLRLQSADIKKVLSAIEKRTPYRFLYNEALVAGKPRVDLNVVNEEVTAVLDRLLKANGIGYRVLDNKLVVLKAATEGAETPAPDIRVTGRVTGAGGEALAGVSVSIRGTSTGTTTDAGGNFTITVPDENAVLVFSFVGFASQEVTVGNRTAINVTLAQSAASQLESVVVIGYGTANRRDLTGSISTVRGRDVADRPATNPVASIQGKVAGVHVVNNGRPGASPDVRIRGTNSINGVQPLYVVDGILNDNINFINPADIESMEILKDPSSLAIYGVRGANGVIIITTKRAKAGQLQVNFNSTVGSKRVVNRIEMANAAQFKELYDEQLRNQGAPAYNYANWQADTDWQDLIFQNGMLNYNNISITGASERNKFYMGLGYMKEEGVIKNEMLQKFTLNINDEFQVSKALKFGFTLNGYRSRLPQEQNVGGAIVAAPIADPFNEETGLYGTLPEFQRAQVWNPLIDVELRANTTRNYEYRAVGSIFGEVNFLRNFNWRSAFFADYGFNQGRGYSPLVTVYNPDIVNADPLDSLQRITSVNQYQNIFTKIQQDHLLTYKNRFGDHNLTVLGGFTSYYNSFQGVNSARNQGATGPIPNDPRFWYTEIGDQASTTGSGNAWETATLSYLFRTLYSFQNRYLLNASFRRDGSSAFPKDGGRWQSFGAIGAGWVVSQEDFMNDVAFVDYLKIKGSWGVLGNQNVGDNKYPYFPLLTSANSAVFGNNVVQALRPTYLADPNLHWETVRSWEAGLELNTLGNKLHFEGTYYNKLTKGVLVTVPALATGALPGLSNLGEVANNGLEFSASWTNRVGNDLTYTVSGNLTTINNKVLQLSTKGYRIVEDPSRTEEGFPIGYFYGYVANGIYQTNEEIKKSAVSSIGEVKPGDIKYRDVNGDGFITEADRTMLGNPTPDFTYGGSVNISYKGFDFNVDVMGVYGNEIFRQWNRGNFAQFNFPLYRQDRWNGVGTSNWEPILHTGRTNNYLISSYYIEDGSFFRIRNLQIGYNFPSSLMNRLHLKSLRIYANAQNPVTFFNSSGYTPEFGGSATSFGIDAGSYPVPAIYTLGINLNF